MWESSTHTNYSCLPSRAKVEPHPFNMARCSSNMPLLSAPCNDPSIVVSGCGCVKIESEKVHIWAWDYETLNMIANVGGLAIKSILKMVALNKQKLVKCIHTNLLILCIFPVHIINNWGFHWSANLGKWPIGHVTVVRDVMMERGICDTKSMLDSPFLPYAMPHFKLPWISLLDFFFL